MSTLAEMAPIERPHLALLGLEPWRAAYEYARHAFAHTSPTALEDGHPVIIFPGMATGGFAVAPMRRHVERLGYAAADWRWGINTGPRGNVDDWLGKLASHTADMLAPFEQSATLIGWSLGGLYARELAKRLGTRVRQVITLGTPFNAGADHTRVGWLFELLSSQSPANTAALSTRLRVAPSVPTTSIYSRFDGIVAWQSCRGDPQIEQRATIEDIEVRGSHLGLGWNPEVLRIVADRLAQPVGGWRPYAAGRGA